MCLQGIALRACILPCHHKLIVLDLASNFLTLEQREKPFGPHLFQFYSVFKNYPGICQYTFPLKYKPHIRRAFMSLGFGPSL